MQRRHDYRTTEEIRSNQAIWGPICRECLTEIAMQPAVYWLATSGSLGIVTLGSRRVYCNSIYPCQIMVVFTAGRKSRLSLV